MEYIYAALSLHAAGKEVTEESLKKVVEALGEKPDEAMVKSVISGLKNVNIAEVIKNAQTTQAAATAEAAAAPAQGAKKEEKSEAEEKKSEEEAASGLASLFG